MQNDLVTLESELTDLQGQLGELGIYKPKMIQVNAGNKSGETIGKTIGNVFWATILLPHKTIMKAAQSTGILSKIAKLPTQVGKIIKAVVTGKEITKTYATANRIAKAKNFLIQTVSTINKAKAVAPTAFLGYLMLEHWGEKLGAQFDSPLRFEEDSIYRKSYNEQKRRIESDIRKKQTEIYQRKVALGTFKTEQQRKAAKFASLDSDENELKRRLARHEDKLHKDAKKKSWQNWKCDWAEYYCEKFKKFLIEKPTLYLEDLPLRLENYQAQRFEALELRLAAKREEYDSLAALKEDDVAKKLTRIENVLNFLESAGCR